MAPTFQEINKEAIGPLIKGKITQEEAFDKGTLPLKEFMTKHTREKDLELFLNYSGAKRPEKIEDISLIALVPAYSISELKSAFQMGFMIFVPFLVIDMVVASVLMAMGMMMRRPS